MVVNNLNSCPEFQDKEVHLAIGSFDGIHRGHQALIDSAINASKKTPNTASAVLTFWPHASKLFSPDNAKLCIMSPETKNSFLLNRGVDLVIEQTFNHEFAKIKADEFLPLLKKCFPKLRSIYVGENFRFGFMREGNAEFLKKQGQKHTVQVFTIQHLTEGDEIISSSKIRKELTFGNIELVNKLLGYTYFSESEVVEGTHRAHELGYPTLSMHWRPECKPMYGVYAVKVQKKDEENFFKAVANYGVRPTMTEDTEPTLEVHLLEEANLKLGDTLKVYWYAFIRPEKKFSSPDDLKEQIAKDKTRALENLA